MSIKADHAIVIGGSIAGLSAAAVLSEHFTRVTVLERDVLPVGPERERRGVPQSFHLHGLSSAGRAALDEIFGDFGEELIDAGAPSYDVLQHNPFLVAEGWLKRAPSDIMGIWASRWMMEHVIRTLTRRISNISLDEGQVNDLLLTGNRRDVCGVRVRSRSAGEFELHADLVIDASGRGSKAQKWLEQAGYAPPLDTIVQPFLGYATCYCHVPDEAWPGDVRSLVAAPFPGWTRGGFVVRIEDDLVGIMAAGTAKDYPPGDQEGFTEFLRTANTSLMYDLWQAGEPQTPIKTTKTSVNRLRRWHELSDLPMGFMALGDAVAAFNPVYGQGITTAALQATALREALRGEDDLGVVVRSMHTKAVAVSSFAWAVATESDLAFPTTKSHNFKAGPGNEEAKQYMGVLRTLATEDSYVSLQFLRAITEMRPEVLDTPEVAALVQQRATLPIRPVTEIPPLPDWTDDQSSVTSAPA